MGSVIQLRPRTVPRWTGPTLCIDCGTIAQVDVPDPANFEQLTCHFCDARGTLHRPRRQLVGALVEYETAEAAPVLMKEGR